MRANQREIFGRHDAYEASLGAQIRYQFDYAAKSRKVTIIISDHHAKIRIALIKISRRLVILDIHAQRNEMKIPAIQKLGKILDLIGANAQNGCKLMQVPLNLNDLLKGGRWLVKRGDDSVTADPIEMAGIVIVCLPV